MNHDNDLVTIKILDREYKIKCSSDEAHALRESARYVDNQMRKVRQSGMATNSDRIAVVTALNICHELLQIRKQQNLRIDMMNQRIQDLQTKIADVLVTEETLPA